MLTALLSLLLAGAAAGASASAPASASASAAVDPLGVQVRVLGNGLTVMLSVNRERPEVFGAVVVRTGARNDPAGETGMAHYLEHMLFKGTRRLGTTDWAAEAPLQERLEELYERKRTAPAGEQAAICGTPATRAVVTVMIALAIWL